MSGGAPGTDHVVTSLCMFDDGSGAGPALYAAGMFSIAGGKSASRIAKWDGGSWSALGSGVNDDLYAMAVFDDGSGPALYAGGEFTEAGGASASGIAKWDGSGWSPLGAGVAGWVRSLTVLNDGSGPALYVGGQFTSAGGVSANNIARWDGQSWSALGTGMNNGVYALAVFDDGSGAGPALHAAGSFTSAGGVPVRRVARWDGASWSSLGSGMNGSVFALAVFDDGSGPTLCAGGSFTSAGSHAASRVAKWDGADWTPLASGVGAQVNALHALDDGSGPALFAGGFFTVAGGGSAARIAKWDGQSWSALSSGVDAAVQALIALEGGSGAGPVLCAGGQFLTAGGESAYRVATWDGQSWSALGGGPDASVLALAVHDDAAGGGPALYVGGELTLAGGESASGIARWDGGGWSALGSGMNARVRALCAFDDGGGPALYAGGDFTSAGGVSANRIARWDGQGWSALQSGLDGFVHALAVFDDGGGPALYAAGEFTTAGGASANRIARWDGQSWSALGSGLDRAARALAVFDDGSGPALYASGDFETAGGVSARRIARWDGQSWSPLGFGVGAPFSATDSVRALVAFDDGSGAGPALYVGGAFDEVAGGTAASNVARWNGTSWSALGAGLNDDVHALGVFDDESGGGPSLYAGGEFSHSGGSPASAIARWDGQAWNPLAGVIEGDVLALCAFDDGSGAKPALYAGGSFVASPGGDSFFAKWGCHAIEIVPGCFGNTAALAALSSEALLGSSFAVELSSTAILDGFGILFFGADGTDALGCGPLSGLGELLLSFTPMPLQAGSGVMLLGIIPFTIPVPSDPSAVGVEVAFQGAVLGVFVPEFPIELSNALAVTVTQ